VFTVSKQLTLQNVCVCVCVCKTWKDSQQRA